METHILEPFFEQFDPHYDSANIVYKLFLQEDGFAVKTYVEKTISSGGKTWKKWSVPVSCHVKIKTLKNGENSVNVFVRAKEKRTTQLVNVSRDITSVPMPLFIKFKIVEQIIEYTKHFNTNYHEALSLYNETFKKLETTAEKPLEHYTPTPVHVSLIPRNSHLKEASAEARNNLRKIVTSIIYPISLNLHPSNIVDGSPPRNYFLTKVLRAKNTKHLMSILGLNSKPETQLTVAKNISQLNYLNLNLIRQVNKKIIDDHTTSRIVEKIFNHPIPEHTFLSAENNTQPWIFNPYAVSSTEKALEAFNIIFKKISLTQFESIISDTDFINFMYGLEKRDNRIGAGKEIRDEVKIHLLLLGMDETAEFTASSFTELMSEIITHASAYRTHTAEDVRELLKDICDNKHIIGDSFLYSWEDGWLPSTPRYNAAINGKVYSGYEFVFPHKLQPTYYMFKFIPYHEAYQTKIGNSNSSTKLILSETSYYNLLKNMSGYAKQLCLKYGIPVNTTNISYIMRGILLFRGFDNKTLRRFMTNMKNGAALPLNMYSIKKRQSYHDTKELSQIPTEWLEKIYPQIEHYSSRVFVKQNY